MQHLLKHAPALTSIEAQLVMFDAYEVTYGIFDHSKKTDMAIVLKHEAEDIEVFDPTTERLILYHNAGVLKYTGITFDRFLELPRHRGETLMLASQELMKQELEEKRKAAAALEEEKQKLGKQ